MQQNYLVTVGTDAQKGEIALPALLSQVVKPNTTKQAVVVEDADRYEDRC